MAEKRHDIRADFEEKGILYIRDSIYLVTVNNFSLGGALVRFPTATPALHIGDRCKLKMDGGSLQEYTCEVIRVETTKIALKFADKYNYKSKLQRVSKTH